jgi:four helix bundle protein
MAFCRFEELKVFQLAEQLADEVWDIVISWNYFEKETVGKQLVQASDSVGANISEGSGRGTPKDNRRFIRIARGSFNETKFWLRRANKRDLLSTAQIENLKKIIDNLGPCLNGYLKSIGGTG